jgi:hypothetical protein
VSGITRGPTLALTLNGQATGLDCRVALTCTPKRGAQRKTNGAFTVWRITAKN